ncbi:MAG: Ig-like domain-containing protein, partial [bacterium]
SKDRRRFGNLADSGDGSRIQASEGMEAQVTIRLRGIQLTVTSATQVIPGDGVSALMITARLKEEEGIPIAGAQVRFSAFKGSIPFSATTDPTGTTQVSYTAPRQEQGQDTIIARYGSELTDTLIIRFANPIARMNLRSSSPSLLGNGKSFVDLTATVTGETGRPAPDVEVGFDADEGYLQPSRAITDSAGRANARYLSFFTSQDETVAVRAWVVTSSLTSLGTSGAEIKGSPFINRVNPFLRVTESAKPLLGNDAVLGGYPSEGFSGEKVEGRGSKEKPRMLRSLSPAQSEVRDSLLLVIRGVGLSSRLASEVVVGRAGASVQVVARLFESRTRRPITNDTLYFETDWGTIPPLAITDEEGNASVVWRLSEPRTGEVNISVSYGVLRERHSLNLVSPVGSLTLTSDRRALLAGGLRSARISAIVRDFQNTPSPSIPVLFLVGNPPSDSLTVITDSTGTASFSLRSFPTEVDSSIWVKAQVENFADSLQLDIRAVRRRLTVLPDTLSAGGSLTATITFTAYEQLTQQPVVGDTVWFNAMGGQVDNWGVLDPTGRVRVTFRPGQEVGIASVEAQLGNLTPVTTNIVLVEPLHHLILLTARPSLLGNGLDTTTLTIQAFNIVGQPTSGARIALRPSMGRVEPPEVTTDNSGRAQALYTGGASPIDTSVYLYAFASMPPQSSPQPEDEELHDARITLAVPVTEGLSSSREAPRSPPREAERVNFSPSSPSALFNPNPMSQFSESRVKEQEEIRDSLAIRLRGVSLNLRIAPRQIRADGRSKAGVWVQLRERTSGVAIPGARIGLGATLGSIAAEGVTRADGTFTDSLTAGLESGECRVVAFYGDRLEAQDTLFFLPDPNRVNLTFEVEPDTVVVGRGEQVRLRAVVSDGFGSPLERMAIGFAVLSPQTILIDTAEYREVNRWVTAVEIDELDGVQGLRIALQLRGVDHPETRLLVNRREVAGLALPRSPLWGDYTIVVPPQMLQGGVNRMEMVGGGEGENGDRFSLAGVRVALIKEAVLAYRETDRSGQAQLLWDGDPSSGRAELKAFLVDQPARSSLRRVVIVPGAPGRILLSPGQDTVIALGETGSVPIGLIVTDRMGNPVRGGYQVRLEATGGAEISPSQVTTLTDGTASATLYPPLAFADTLIDLRAQLGELENRWHLALLGIRADLTSNRDRALADGSSQILIRGTLHTTQGTPLSGRRIQFTTTRGNITPTGVTDQRGEVQAVLTAPVDTGSATVRMAFGHQVLDSLTVVFVSPVGELQLTAEPQTLRGDGLDSTLLTVIVLNGLDEPAEGMRVSLSVSSGVLRSRTLMTDARGEASTLLFAPAVPQDFNITAVASLDNGRRDTLI